MEFYTQTHQYFCGIDLHTKTMSLCILDPSGEVVLHTSIPTKPKPFLKAIKPFRDDLVVGVECMFSWYWLANLCIRENNTFVLGQSLYMTKSCFILINNTFYLNNIRSVFPDACVIHMIRDGRDVVRSYVAIGQYDIAQAGERWCRSVRLCRRFGNRYPNQFLEVRYEDLVSRPDKWIRTVCGFLDLVFDESMLQHHESSATLGDVEQLAHHARVREPISTNAVGQWRAFFDSEQRLEVERVLNPLLRQVGYR